MDSTWALVSLLTVTCLSTGFTLCFAGLLSQLGRWEEAVPRGRHGVALA